MTEVAKPRRSISIPHAAERARVPLQEIQKLVFARVLGSYKTEKGMWRVYIDSLNDYISKRDAVTQVEQSEEVTLNEAVLIADLPRDIILEWVHHGEVAARTDHLGVLLVDFNTVKRRMKGMSK